MLTLMEDTNPFIQALIQYRPLVGRAKDGKPTAKPPQFRKVNPPVPKVRTENTTFGTILGKL